MSDNLRQYRAIRDALTQGSPGKPTGRLSRPLATLAAFISGMVASKSTQLPKVASHVPDGTKPESRVTRLARWVDNDTITVDASFFPQAPVLLAPLALQTLVLVIDGSVVGRGGVARMMHVVYKGRAVPLAWRVRTGKKGHFPEALPIALVEQVQKLIPAGVSVVLLGDGAFDGTGLQHTMARTGWSSVCRTGCHMTASWQGETLRLDTLGGCLKPGTLVDCSDVRLTEEAYGPILLLCCWAKGQKEPLSLVSNMAAAEEACRLYGQRCRIATFFSDQKSRGFHLQQSHLSDPMRLSRLLMAAGVAYIWIIYLGALCEQDGWVCIIHRGDRCDRSLFQLGLRLLEHFFNEGFSIPVAFHISI